MDFLTHLYGLIGNKFISNDEKKLYETFCRKWYIEYKVQNSDCLIYNSWRRGKIPLHTPTSAPSASFIKIYNGVFRPFTYWRDKMRDTTFYIKNKSRDQNLGRDLSLSFNLSLSLDLSLSIDLSLSLALARLKPD